MTLSKSQKEANKRYLKKHKLVEIKIRVTSEKRADYQQRISLLPYSSFNDFLIQAIEEKLERDESKK